MIFTINEGDETMVNSIRGREVDNKLRYVTIQHGLSNTPVYRSIALLRSIGRFVSFDGRIFFKKLVRSKFLNSYIYLLVKTVVLGTQMTSTNCDMTLFGSETQLVAKSAKQLRQTMQTMVAWTCQLFLRFSV